MNLSYGSRGDEVKRLQTALNQNGYNLSVDGIYGVKTQAAVRDYQGRESLSVDGIAGPLTQGRLYGSGTSSGSSSGSGGLRLSGVSESVKEALETPYSPPKATETETPEAPDFSYLDAAWEALQNQGPFSYDLESDPLYRQYAAMYQRWGPTAIPTPSRRGPRPTRIKCRSFRPWRRSSTTGPLTPTRPRAAPWGSGSRRLCSGRRGSTGATGTGWRTSGPANSGKRN